MAWTRRNFASWPLGAAAAGLLARSAAAQSPVRDPLPMVDPELRPVAAGMLKASLPEYSPQTLAFMRRGMPLPPRPRLPEPAVVERKIEGAPGAPPVRILMINAGAAAAGRPAILHIHGGGYVLGLQEIIVPDLQRTALDHGCAVVTVDYRLAPETPFPGALEDNYAALKWLAAQAQALGVDPRRIVVMGESAGGGHAAALALHARDRGEIALAGQVLVYPMLDDRTGSTRQPPFPEGAIFWTGPSNRFCWSSLLGVPAGSAQVPAAAVPARTADLSRLPPTFIGVGALDLFVEESIDYGRRLIDAGVATDLLVVPGAFHAFDAIVPQAKVSQRFRAAIDDALATMFARAA
jgi:acetyl esterase/lipase